MSELEPAPTRPSRGRVIGALVVAVGIGAGVFLLLHGRGRIAPALGPTLEHRAALGGQDRQACLACHQSGSAPRRPPGHTGREDCWSCHRLSRD